MKVSFFDHVFSSYKEHRSEAEEAFALFKSYCDEAPRVPGMDTVLRLAVRIDNGRTVEGAAAREYVYRWHLAFLGRAWKPPHTLGM